jgi:hypothetical protein
MWSGFTHTTSVCESECSALRREAECNPKQWYSPTRLPHSVVTRAFTINIFAAMTLVAFSSLSSYYFMPFAYTLHCFHIFFSNMTCALVITSKYSKGIWLEYIRNNNLSAKWPSCQNGSILVLHIYTLSWQHYSLIKEYTNTIFTYNGPLHNVQFSGNCLYRIFLPLFTIIRRPHIFGRMKQVQIINLYF